MARILLVEDNELNRDMLSRRLRRRGYEVVVAVDGADAIATIAASQPDLILMDMSLPIMDGWEATKALKGDPATTEIPIIALTAHAMAGEREKALAAGCDDYDTKPVEINRLLKKMEFFLGVSPTTSSSANVKNSSNPPTNSSTQVPISASPASMSTSSPVSSYPEGPPPMRSGTADHQPLVGKLLVVDDNEANRDMLHRRLKRKGHTVITASSGEEAMAIVQQTRVDAILLDVMMPGVDGFETLRRIRQTYSQLQLPVIMVTAKTESQDMVQAFEWGANDYITKPIDFELAIARIQNQLLATQAVRHQMLRSSQASSSSVSTEMASSSVSTTPQASSSPSFTPSSSSIAQPDNTVEYRPSSLTEFQKSDANPTPRLIADRYAVLQVLAETTVSELLTVQDTQELEQPFYFLKRLNIAALPTASANSTLMDAARTLLQQEIPQLKTMGQHSHITSFLETFEYDGSLYLVQEFVEGTLLANEFQARSPLPFTQAVPLFKDLFDTLEFLHAQGIIHGELQSHHLIRRQGDEQLTLIDFGMTQRMLTQLAPIALADRGNGNGYMPPEQPRGTFSYSSDVYALGMLMLHALTGKAPEHIDRDPLTGELKWRELATVDDKTAAVIQKMVAQDLTQRYTFAEDASKDLLFQWYTLRFKRTLS